MIQQVKYIHIYIYIYPEVPKFETWTGFSPLEGEFLVDFCRAKLRIHERDLPPDDHEVGRSSAPIKDGRLSHFCDQGRINERA